MSYTFEKEKIELLPDGDYEAVIESIGVVITSIERIQIMYRLTNNEKYNNRVIYESIFHEKDNPQFFNRKRLNKLLASAIPDLADNTEFKDIYDIFDNLRNKNIVLHIITQLNEYKGENENRVHYYKPSKIQPQKLDNAGGSSANQAQAYETTNVDINDDDLPF